MDYKKKSLKKLNHNESYEEIDTRLASGWYVDTAGDRKKKQYKTKEITFKIARKLNWISSSLSELFNLFTESSNNLFKYHQNLNIFYSLILTVQVYEVAQNFY